MTDQSGGVPDPQITAVDVTQANKTLANVVMTMGIVTGVFGLIMLFWPGATVRVVAILFGIWLLITGLILFAQAFAAGISGGARILLALVGALSVIVGGTCIFNSDASVKILVIFVLIGWLANGIANIVVGLRDKYSPNRSAYLTVGIVQIVLAILVIAWPEATVTVLVRLIGIGLIITAALELWVASKIRKSGPEGEVIVVSQ